MPTAGQVAPIDDTEPAYRRQETHDPIFNQARGLTARRDPNPLNGLPYYSLTKRSKSPMSRYSLGATYV